MMVYLFLRKFVFVFEECWLICEKPNQTFQEDLRAVRGIS